MFQRRNQNDVLPSTHYGTGGGGGGGLPSFGGGGGTLDGSGRSIKMQAPIVKAWKTASGYTRTSYYFLGVTLLMVFYGFRSLRYWNGTSNRCTFVHSLIAVDFQSRTILSATANRASIFSSSSTFFVSLSLD